MLEFDAKTESILKVILSNPKIGKEYKGYRSFVIAEQTTLYYLLDENSKKVSLIVFWAAHKNPEGLDTMLFG